MVFENGVKNIQAAAYNGARTVVSSVLALEATEPLSVPVTQMAVELINNHIFQYSKRDECKSYILFHVKTTTNIF